uniref:Uncharacterized protein n=1 Tax=Quercus lobata TaxID=97700 RepID=A0A7N2R993_QUELO
MLSKDSKQAYYHIDGEESVHPDLNSTLIVSFVVSFRLGNDYKNDVDEWIRSAIGMGAERLYSLLICSGWRTN